uniref:DNA-directed DNA polymerase n=1 Tax=Globodera rostochiensis TaxID=31243 RepID=A0A914I5W4_GLORO
MSKRPSNFNIDDILAPKKPRHGFLINQLLGVVHMLGSVQHGDGPSTSSATTTKKAAKDYVKKLDCSLEHVAKFNYVKLKSRFFIEDVPANPESLLAGIFQHCIDVAKKDSRDRSVHPTHLGCMISSPLLTGGDIPVPVRQLTDNTIDTILNQFNKVAQSKQQKNVTLWGEPFTVVITTVDRTGLPSKRRVRGGARRKLAQVHHKVHDQCLIKIHNDNDSFCLFYALQATMLDKTCGWPRTKFFEYLHSQHGQQGRLQKETLKLMKQVRAPRNLKAYDADTYVPRVVDHWNNTQQKHRFAVFIFGSTGQYKPIYKYVDNSYDTPLLLYFNNDHFDGVQKQGGLFGRKYCLECEVPYRRASQHNKCCKARCMLCGRAGPSFPCSPEADFLKHCAGCKKNFKNNMCYLHHLSSNFCRRSKKCKECGVIWDVPNNTQKGRQGHKCGERFCTLCNNYHNIERGCFIQPLVPKENDPFRIVAFDLETMQHLSVDAAHLNNRSHEPNFVSARIACPECIDNGKWRSETTGCKVCGLHRTVAFCQRPFFDTKVDKQVVADNPLEAFVDWLVNDLPIKYDSYVYSHFGGRFDMVITFRELFKIGFNPDMLRKGNKMYEMRVRKQKGRNPNIVFRDSFNLMPSALAALVPQFGLDVADKPFFPHLSNCPQNYGQRVFPTPDDYLSSGMMPEKRRQFDQWYELHQHEPFYLDEALPSYCTNDVDILMEALVAFRREFFEVSRRNDYIDGIDERQNHDGIDALRETMTIAGACMRHFRTNHLPSEHLAIVPEKGYDNAQNQSLLALRFFYWYAEENGVQVQTAHSPGGEKRVAQYSLDGWIEAEQRAIEVHGCVWHGCAECYPDDNQVLPNGKTAGAVRERDSKRLEFLRTQVSRVDVFWECEIQRMLDGSREMRKKFVDYVDDGPLEIRAAFTGGRTGPAKLFHKAAEGEKISYYDFTSLYPYINFTTRYPIGHPTVHVLNENVEWTTSAHNPYPLALLKVWVVPPRRIDVPILPVKVDERLCFPLCMKCAKEYPTGGVDDNYHCAHSDNQRGWVSTCTSLELNAALDEGYRVTKVFRVLAYDESDNKLFRPYIAEFMTKKIEASGFDAAIKGNAELEAEFVRECEEQFGITIDPAKMVPNKGKRALAKLCLNNLWGRFSLRNFGLSQTLIADDPAVLAEYLDNKSIDVTSIDELDEDHILISYMTKQEWVEEHSCSNIIVSLWTTSAARLLLLKAMQKVVRSPGCTLLYTDTDSLVFVHPSDRCPLETGPHLGQFTDEFPLHVIEEFCSGGAKQYGLKLKRKDADADNEYILKVRGITLNNDVMQNQGLCYNTFKEAVLRYANTGEVERIQVMYPNFLRPSIKDARVISAPLQKCYKPYVGKGIVSSNFNVLNFGHTL